jgi:hypothetical protein
MSDISSFKDWLIARGGRLLELENRFERLRVIMPGHDEALVMYVTARDKQEWSPALLELHTEFEKSKAPLTGYPSSADRYGGV